MSNRTALETDADTTAAAPQPEAPRHLYLVTYYKTYPRRGNAKDKTTTTDYIALNRPISKSADVDKLADQLPGEVTAFSYVGTVTAEESAAYERG